MPTLINEIPFHTVICSRYIGFLEMYSNCSFYKFYIWAHDTSLLHYGSNLSSHAILEKWSNYIDGCICQTNWHADSYKKAYPTLKDKIVIINNGIEVSAFPSSHIKQNNKFIYTSRTERGLTRVLELWPQILSVMPDAELVISTYTKFPLNKEEEDIKIIIDKYPSIRHLGRLGTEQLYNEMSTSDFWLYPTCWPETSCITALEMLMSEVICLYYPVAGLIDTIDKYGLQIRNGNEIETLINLTSEQKQQLRSEGKAYALSCSWENRAKIWSELFERKQTILFFLPFWYNVENLKDYFDSYRSKYNVIYTNNPDEALRLTNVDKVIFVFELSSEIVYKHFNKQKESQNNLEISILNTEPMNLVHRFENIKKYDPSNDIHKLTDDQAKEINENGFTILKLDDGNEILGDVETIVRTGSSFTVTCVEGTVTFEVQKFPKSWTSLMSVDVCYKIAEAV